MSAPVTQAPLASTPLGAIRGFAANGVRRWLGIPYAHAPRLGAPQPLEPWQGEREATSYGAQCPQMFGSKARRAMAGKQGYGEDCLALNVFVPEREARAEERQDGRPVYVFIHGGAFLAGSSNPYDGSWLADLGDIVVVTVNYRVGVLGFVDFGGALGLPDIPSNIGLRDQIAALEWVRDNIAAFGGDPGRVTVGGQSAGSMSVSLLMLAPKARGLFHGAVLQSGAVSLIHDKDAALANARKYVDHLGLDQSSLEHLRSMELQRLFEAQAAAQATLTNAIAAAPWYDDDLLPASLADARAHDAAQVPLLAGATREEMRLFEMIGRGILPHKREEIAPILEHNLGSERANAILSAYADDKAGNRALATDLAFVIPTRNFAERHAGQQPTWFYRFDYRHPLVGAAHGIDLTLTWPFSGIKGALMRGGRFAGRRAALGERMNRHLAHFVRHGAPMEGWPRYSADARKAMIFDLEDRIESDPDAARFAAWGGMDAPARMGADG